ncbi:hypothetical protein BDW02DRAFT_458153, partial [Decorospora gaudefroyi]
PEPSKRYRPLESPDEIRLIFIKPFVHDPSEDIECDNDPKIRVDGHTTVVRRNLFDALVSLRDRQDCGIWIDALSINQANTLERNHQVHLMGMIYSIACEVLIWLGFTELFSEQALDVISREPEFNPKSLESINTDAVLDSSVFSPVLRICQSTYWNRAWIQQEVYLAR